MATHSQFGNIQHVLVVVAGASPAVAGPSSNRTGRAGAAFTEVRVAVLQKGYEKLAKKS